MLGHSFSFLLDEHEEAWIYPVSIHLGLLSQSVLG